MEWKTSSCICVVGRRGSGKSVFVKEVVWRNLERCICHDRKHEHSFEGIPTVHTVPEAQGLWAQGYEKLVYQPWDSSYEDFDALCEAIFNHANTALWVDEVGSISSSSVCPHWYGELMRLGRIRGIGLINVTQRPMGVTNLIFSEAELVVSFRLQLYNDALKIAQVAGERIVPIVMGLDDYEFIVSDGNETQVCTPLQINDGESEVNDREVQTNESTEDELETQGPGSSIGGSY